MFVRKDGVVVNLDNVIEFYSCDLGNDGKFYCIQFETAANEDQDRFFMFKTFEEREEAFEHIISFLAKRDLFIAL